MAKVTGSVDDLGRPVVRLEGAQEGILVIVDTGFNSDLMVTRAAARVLGVERTEREIDIELGNGTMARVLRGRATVSWLGEQRLVQVMIADDWQTTGDAPAGLLGTSLLAPHLLMIDFGSKTVEIETQA